MITATPDVEQKSEMASSTLHSITIRICTMNILWHGEVDENTMVRDLIIDICKQVKLTESPDDYNLTLDKRKLDINDTIKKSGLLNSVDRFNSNYPELQKQEYEDEVEGLILHECEQYRMAEAERLEFSKMSENSTNRREYSAGNPMSLLYIGNLHPNVTDAMLFDKFSSAGSILSVRVARDMITRRSLGFAYINFEQPADAERARDTMNFDLFHGHELRIMWASYDRALRISGVGTIFIKNLDQNIDNKSLYDTFSAFGNILSCKIMTDENGNSKGIGFVDYETQEAADSAIAKVNGMLLNDKKVFLCRFTPRNQRKFVDIFIKNFGDQLDEEKLRKLLSQYGKITACKIAMDENGKSKGFGFCRYENPEEAEAAVQNLNGHTIGDKQLYVGRFQNKAMRQSEIKRKTDLRQQSVAYAHAASTVVSGQEPLTPATLANATPQQQKQMLGERLFPLIKNMQPDLAGKITGMLLEIDHIQLLHMLESSESLKAKVEEAAAVIQAHQAKQIYAAKQAAATLLDHKPNKNQ